LIEQIHNARPATRYKGRGVNIKEQPMVLKEGKKALW
jgi:ribosomal protein L6P/L9E